MQQMPIVDPQSLQALYDLLGSLGVVIATSLIKREHYNRYVNFGIATALSVVAGILSAYLSGSLTSAPSVLATIFIILGAATVHYKTWFDWLTSSGNA